MNLLKSNNPAVIGAMVVLLIASLYFVVQSLQKVVASAATTKVATTSDGSSDDAESPSVAAPIGPRPIRSATVRDPFHRPSNDGPEQNPERAIPAENETERNTIPAPSIDAGNHLPPLGVVRITGPSRPIEVTPATVPAPQGDTEESAPADATDTWRVTAIFGGDRKSASIEGTGGRPRVVATGDSIEGYEVTAVTDKDVILTSETGSMRTISLGGSPAAPDGQGKTNANVDKSAAEETYDAPSKP